MSLKPTYSRLCTDVQPYGRARMPVPVSSYQSQRVHVCSTSALQDQQCVPNIPTKLNWESPTAQTVVSIAFVVLSAGSWLCQFDDRRVDCKQTDIPNSALLGQSKCTS